MTADELALKYIEALESQDLNGIIALFTENGQVISPLYGQLPAVDFYGQLFNDTQYSQIQLNDVFDNSPEGKVAIFFKYRWHLKGSETVSFDVVDLIELSDGKIEKLTIIYDTFQTRQVFNQRKLGEKLDES